MKSKRQIEIDRLTARVAHLERSRGELIAQRDRAEKRCAALTAETKVARELRDRYAVEMREAKGRLLDLIGFVADEVTRMRTYGATALSAMFEDALRRARG